MNAKALVNRPTLMLEHLLTSHSNELVQGGADKIRGAMAPKLGRLSSSAAVAREFFDYLGTDYGKRTLKPNLNADETKTPLERVIAKLPFQASSVTKVAGELQLHIGHLETPGKMAEAVLGYAGFGPHVVNAGGGTMTPRHFRDDIVPEFQPPIPHNEARVRKVLDERFHDVLPEQARESLARSIGPEMMSRSDRDLVPLIAKMLTVPLLVEKYNPGGKRVESDDPRLTEDKNWALRAQQHQEAAATAGQDAPARHSLVM